MSTNPTEHQRPSAGQGPKPLFWTLSGIAMVLLVARVGSLLAAGNLGTIDRIDWRNASGSKVEYQCVSSEPCVLWVGQDNEPGQLGWDDNGDGEVDNHSELGAVHSDDRLLTHTDPNYAVALKDERTRRMFPGGYHRCDSDAYQRRWVIFRDFQGENRSWVVYAPESLHGNDPSR